MEWIQIKSERKFDSADKKKKLEAEKIKLHIGSSYIIALDEHGEMLTSKEFALKISQWSQYYSCITFIIGGADGLDQSVLKLANFMHVPFWKKTRLICHTQNTQNLNR